MPTKWGKPTEDEEWEAGMRRRKRRARILLIARVVSSVIALAIISVVFMWLLDVFNHQFGDCFDRYGELTYHQERCLTYDSPTVDVWFFAIGSVVIGLLVVFIIASLIAAPVSRARSRCSCESACEHEQARQNALAMGVVLGVILGSNHNN